MSEAGQSAQPCRRLINRNVAHDAWHDLMNEESTNAIVHAASHIPCVTCCERYATSSSSLIFLSHLTRLSLAACFQLRASHLGLLTALHSTLRVLDLGHNETLDDTAGPAIASLTRLEALTIDRDAAVDHIFASCTRLHSLSAQHVSTLTSAAFRHVHYCSHLAALLLAHTNVDCALLNHIQHLPKLRVLDVSGSQLRHVPLAPPSLEVLHVDGAPLATAPHRPPTLPSLHELAIDQGAIQGCEAADALLLLLQHATRLQRLAIRNTGGAASSECLLFLRLPQQRVDVSQLTSLHLQGAALWLPTPTYLHILSLVLDCRNGALFTSIAIYCPLLHDLALDIVRRSDWQCMHCQVVAMVAAMPRLAWLRLRDSAPFLRKFLPALHKLVGQLKGVGFDEVAQFWWHGDAWSIALHASRRGGEPWDMGQRWELSLAESPPASIIEHMLQYSACITSVGLDCVANARSLARLVGLPRLNAVELHNWQPQCGDVQHVLGHRALETCIVHVDSSNVGAYQGWLAAEAMHGWVEDGAAAQEGVKRLVRCRPQRPVLDQRWRYTCQELLAMRCA